jgi:hypothetical protein
MELAHIFCTSIRDTRRHDRCQCANAYHRIASYSLMNRLVPMIERMWSNHVFEWWKELVTHYNTLLGLCNKYWSATEGGFVKLHLSHYGTCRTTVRVALQYLYKHFWAKNWSFNTIFAIKPAHNQFGVKSGNKPVVSRLKGLESFRVTLSSIIAIWTLQTNSTYWLLCWVCYPDCNVVKGWEIEKGSEAPSQ